MSMAYGARSWTAFAIFQVVFGLTVFGLTRYYYADSDQRPAVSASASATARLPGISPDLLESVSAQLDSSVTPQLSAMDFSTIQDPAELARLADQFFANRQYDHAATLYERLLTFNRTNADTLNNLGITLHYLGRSQEALATLNEATTANPAHQRSWLTIGFVNSQLVDVEQARAALTRAIELGTDADVTQSAQSMLDALP